MIEFKQDLEETTIEIEEGKMHSSRSQYGFTLVELAIVMTIIGLLIGGILKGQELMANGRVTATIAQVKSFEAAATSFRDRYDALPGDMVNADLRIPNCNSNCNVAPATPAAEGTGDSLVGLLGGVGDAQTGTSPALQGNAEDETILFWTHLLLSDMIAGVSDAAIVGADAAWGETHPPAPVGGGFHVKQGAGDGTTVVVGAGTAIQQTGLLVVLRPTVSTDLSATAGVQVLQPYRASQIDRKLDDGKSTSGFVTAYGVTASCLTGGANGDSYDETSKENNCGLMFRIQD